MLWFPLAMLVALCAAGEAVIAKKFYGHLPALAMAGVPAFFTLPLFLLLIPFVHIGDAPPAFWWTVAMLAPLNTAGFLCHFTAVNLSPVSLVMPFLSFTPLFVIAIGYLILGETVSIVGSLGILAIVAGSYVINLETVRDGDWLAPFKSLVVEPGTRLMVVAAAIYALCAVLGKRMILLADPLSAALVFFVLFDLLVLVVLAARKRLYWRQWLATPWVGLLAGVVSFTHYTLHMVTVSMVQVAYFVSVKRMSGLFSVVLGGLVFRETNLGYRLAGAGLMFLGALAITLGG